MKKILCICFVVVIFSTAALVAKAVEGGPTGWGWCSTCRADRGPGHDFTHGQG
jgi:hypothetical protein